MIHHEERIRSGKELGVLDIYRQANPVQLNISYKGDWFNPKFMLQADNDLISSGLSSSFKIFPSLDLICGYNKFKRGLQLNFDYDDFSMRQYANQIDYENSLAFNFKRKCFYTNTK